MAAPLHLRCICLANGPRAVYDRNERKMHMATDIAAALRQELHQIPEASGQERRTKERLMTFFREHTSLEIHDMGSWFYAARREGENLSGAMVRADMDAVSGEGGAVYHGCGHDGHCANLAALALKCEGRTFGKNLFFLFQPAEETGEGAKQCLALFEKERVDEVYGLHNLPGFDKGSVLVRAGTFACASKGLSLLFSGQQSHAAYPETGRNPAYAIARLIDELPAMAVSRGDGMVMATIVHVRVGERAFGVSAGEGELALTLRAEKLEALDRLQSRIMERARALCATDGLTLAATEQDVFPDTRCRLEDVEAFRARALAGGLTVETLKEPMRWSEDFGWYLKEKRGVFFGLGIGQDHAALHTPAYEYDDDLIETAARALLAAIGA